LEKTKTKVKWPSISYLSKLEAFMDYAAATGAVPFSLVPCSMHWKKFKVISEEKEYRTNLMMSTKRFKKHVKNFKPVIG